MRQWSLEGERAMRDIAVTLIILGSIPFILRRPWVGVLMWTWVGIMNPHRLTWGFAYSMPFAMIIGLATLIALIFSKEKKPFPVTAATMILVAFVLWMNITTLFALYPVDAWTQWEKVMKIQLFVIVTLLVMQTKERIHWLVWVATASLAFYGIKGGIYTLTGSGSGMVLGPDGSFISGNTEISLAITMAIPLMRYLQVNSGKRWVRVGLGVGMVLCAVAVLGSYSRGGLLAIAAVGALFWLKSRRKLLIGAFFVLLVPTMLTVMPERWHDKMQTIKTYEQDTSAMGRINAWGFAINLASSRPITGGGFEVFHPQAFSRWAPDPNDFHDAHSIWFEVLGEHGYVGLALFVALWIAAWRVASAIIRSTKERNDLAWARELAAMIQVSFVGYWVGGSFLGLSYFDLPYVLLAALVLTQGVVERQLRNENAAVAAAAEPASPLVTQHGPR
jgi:probable O-glycosylation ligase (exosortase A-associated)